MKRYVHFLCIIIAAVTAGCAPKEQDTITVHELEVTPLSIDFDADNPENNTFTVTSNVPWRITCDADMKLDRYSGEEGETVVTVMQIPEGKTCTATVSTVKGNISETSVSKEVQVSRTDAGGDQPDPGPDVYEETLVYYDNLDRTRAEQNYDGKYWPYVDQWDGFINKEGPGSAGVTYSGRSVSTRSSFASTGYPGASGVNAFYFGNSSSLSIRNIAVGQDRTFKFTVGMTNRSGLTTSTFDVSVMNQDGKSVPLEYTLEKYGDWSLATILFRVTGEQPSSLSFTIGSADANPFIDDIRLVSTTQPTDNTVTFGEGPVEPVHHWAELPQTEVNGRYEYIADGGMAGDYKYVTHHANTYSSKKYVRNYSACYDTRRHNPMWVAYPFHAIYEEGGWTRPETDPWRNDPKFEESEQSIIYPIDWQSYPDHTDERRWSKLAGMTDYFGRGHLLMSANRGAGNKSVLLDLNVQTFYPTNISPEYHLYPKHWQLVEEQLTGWKCQDTVYVVTGCHYENDNNVIQDASWSGISASYSKSCVVPTAHYKVFLRTKVGNTGKPVQECRAEELMAIGFWFEQKLDSSPFTQQPALSTVTMSVSEIEARTGHMFKFFPDIPEQVKANYNINDWPGLAAISSETYPPYK